MNGVVIKGKVCLLVIDKTQDMNVCKKCALYHTNCERMCIHLGSHLGYDREATERMYLRE